VPTVVGTTFKSRSALSKIRFKHSEYVADLASDHTKEFVRTPFSINPGDESLFPWLSKLADNFEQYEFHSLEFSFSTMQPTTSVGYMILAVDYDASDVNDHLSKGDFLAFDGAAKCPIWSGVSIRCPPSNLKGRRFVRGSPPKGTFDIKMYDLGTLETVNYCNATQTVGELYVSYDVTLYIPEVTHDDYVAAKITVTGGLDATDMLGSLSSTVVEEYDSIGATIEGSGSTRGISVKDPGFYDLFLNWAGTGLTSKPTLTNNAPGTLAWVEDIIDATGTVLQSHYTYKLPHTPWYYDNRIWLAAGGVATTVITLVIRFYARLSSA
jgi:hypothetical protein